MEKNKYLEQVLQNLPESTITYTQKPNEFMNIAYTLQAKDYKELYLNDTQLDDLTPEEHLFYKIQMMVTLLIRLKLCLLEYLKLEI